MEVPDELVVAIEATMLPAGWNRKDGDPLIARSIGDRWLANQVSAGLQVPSYLSRASPLKLKQSDPNGAKLSSFSCCRCEFIRILCALFGAAMRINPHLLGAVWKNPQK